MSSISDGVMGAAASDAHTDASVTDGRHVMEESTVKAGVDAGGRSMEAILGSPALRGSLDGSSSRDAASSLLPIAASTSPAVGAELQKQNKPVSPDLSEMHRRSQSQLLPMQSYQLASNSDDQAAQADASSLTVSRAASSRDSQQSPTADVLDSVQNCSLPEQVNSPDDPEKQEERHRESPGRFAQAQLVLMQQRVQQLQSHRIAGLLQADKLQPVQKVSKQQDRHLSKSVSPGQLSRASSPFTFVSQLGQQHDVDGEEVASSPVVLFSPGGPYSDKSNWFRDMDATQVTKRCSILGHLFTAQPLSRRMSCFATSTSEVTTCLTLPSQLF